MESESFELVEDDGAAEDIGSARARLPIHVLEQHGVKFGQTLLVYGIHEGHVAVCSAAVHRSKQLRIAADVLFRFPAQSAHDSIRVRPVSAVELADAETVRISSVPSDEQFFALRTTILLAGVTLPNGRFEVFDIIGGRFVTAEARGAGKFLRIVSHTKIELGGVAAPTSRQLHTKSERRSATARCNRRAFALLTETIGLYGCSMDLLGARPPRGVLLSGPPGVGKTSAVWEAVQHTGASVVEVRRDEVLRMSTLAGAVEKRLREAFDEAELRSKIEGKVAVIFLDEIDAMCQKRGSSHQNQSSGPVTQLLGLLDGAVARASGGNVIAVAATNRPNELDHALRRPGRFDCELRLSAPNEEERGEILLPMLENEALALRVAHMTAGFVGADLAALVAEAELASGNRLGGPLREVDLTDALLKISPSTLRRPYVVTVRPNKSWDDIAGAEIAKKRLRVALEWPAVYKETWGVLGLARPNGIILHGPPGTSKTTLVQAAVAESGATFVTLSGAEVFSCYLGEAERIIREVFETARAAAPCVLFIDEIDALVGKRGARDEGNSVQERVLSTLLTEMDGVNPTVGVLTIGATNRLDLIDEAILRPGRFDDLVLVGLPDVETREEIFRIHTRNVRLAPEVDLSELASISEGRSGAEIGAFCREAAIDAVRTNSGGLGPPQIERDTFVRVLGPRR